MYLPLTTNYDRVLTNWLNKLSFSPSNDSCKALNTLLKGMRDDGNLIEMDLFHTIGGLQTDEQRLTPLISTSGLAFTTVNSPTLDSTGVTGSSAGASYVNLNWAPSTNGMKWTSTSASLGTYCRTNDAATVSNMGSAASFDSTRRAGDLFYWRINDSGGNNAANTSSLGLSTVRRIASDSTEIYMNGVSKGTGTTATTGLDATAFTLCRHSGSGSSNRNLSLCFAGSGNINVVSLYTRIQTYMTERGLNV